MKHDIECYVCGTTFEAKAENRYTAYEPQGIFGNIAHGDGARHDTFDCPACGCQNCVGIRLPAECEAITTETTEETVTTFYANGEPVEVTPNE